VYNTNYGINHKLILTNIEDNKMSKEQSQRTRRVSFTCNLPTEINPTGSVDAKLFGTDTVVTYSKDLAGIDLFISTAFLAGIRDRFATAISGMQDQDAIKAKLESEVERLDAGEFATHIGSSASKGKSIPDVLRAWASLYKEDIDNEEVFAKYSAAWNGRDEEGQKAIRTNPAVSAAIYTLQAERKAANVKGDVELPSI
jgi:hypothetical protein